MPDMPIQSRKDLSPSSSQPSGRRDEFACKAAAFCRKPLLTCDGDSANLVVVFTQRGPHFFSLFAYLSAFADFRVTGIQAYVLQMRGQSPAPLSCLKWGIDGELSAHDTALLINRLASFEPSRRGFKDHFERRQRSHGSDRPSPMSTTRSERLVKATMTGCESPITALRGLSYR
ncbi:hypothetical protein SynBIOSE41_01501 [Synechococcus sp. BIOS-E4-1]|nr:hypothetical protein SynBIOSE41_01501 [Synechococcus sp. BIOS-E4-1]